MPMTAIGSLLQDVPGLSAHLLGQQRQLDGGQVSLRRRRGVHSAPDTFRKAARASSSERSDKAAISTSVVARGETFVRDRDCGSLRRVGAEKVD